MHLVICRRWAIRVLFAAVSKIKAMRSTALLLMFASMFIATRATSQKITISFNKVPLTEAIRKIGAQTGVSIIYNVEQLRNTAPVTANLKDASVTEALSAVLKQQPFSFELKNGAVILKRKGGPADADVSAVTPPDLVDGMGTVLDKNNNPIQGATLTIKGTKRSFMTGKDGVAILTRIPPNSTVVISAIGYEEQEVKLPGTSRAFTVHLNMKVIELGAIEINTGITKRNKESFTGAATVYSGAQLKAVGNRNVLESLRSLDPSFIRVENNLQGSNPNITPTFEIRGQTTINTNTANTRSLNDQFSQDPNQPLFILDGFETTLQIINDLDMNRVASVTILKDAASTALYGAKASNGVVVVETKRPVPGKLQMSYNADLTLEMPDLTSYNLMNAAEKLEFERLQGFNYATSGPNEWADQRKYNTRLAEVQRGVNTYWLNEPVRTGVSHRHSLQFAGGNSDLMFNAAVSYGKQLGVMKGSNRETWGGNIGVTYRKGKLNLNNVLTLAGSKGDESPFGSFSNFASAIPYYRKRSTDGRLLKYLDSTYDLSAVNPLYNATLNGVNRSQSFSFFNNLNAIYSFSNKFRVQGGLQLSRGNSGTVQFIPPESTQFDNTDITLKGNYANTHTDNTSYSANLMLVYGELIGKSQLSATVRGDISENNSQLTGFSAVGFPYGTDGNPIYATGYTPYGTPTSNTGRSRSAGFLASFNYAWDSRLLLDAVYRLDGASVFGTNHTFKPFVSGGLGWNLHREPLLRHVKNINLLKLRANAGYTGNENLGQFSSLSTFSFQAGNNNTFGQGITLSSLGNPTLDWQHTLQLSYGLDFGFWNNRISGYVEYFDKKTDPLAIGTSGILPSSTGTGGTYTINVGNLTTRGWNFNLRVLPVNDLSRRIIWSIGVMGSNYVSKYGGLAGRLSKLNEEQTASKGLLRFSDGYSPDDLWTVVSHGVDPATGKELFQKKDGTLTYNYSTDDIVKVGNQRPKVEGSINTSLTWRDFTFGAIARYRLGGYVFNTAMYNKVENIGFTRVNLDKRALYDRWKQPGDVAQFTGIANTSSNMSSRFVQEDNHLIGESFSLSWRSYAPWIRDLGLQSLSVSAYLNDIFRIEKIKTERGIDYPYARTASLSLNVSF